VVEESQDFDHSTLEALVRLGGVRRRDSAAGTQWQQDEARRADLCASDPLRMPET
jgi:hypothetical protein